MSWSYIGPSAILNLMHYVLRTLFQHASCHDALLLYIKANKLNQSVGGQEPNGYL